MLAARRRALPPEELHLHLARPQPRVSERVSFGTLFVARALHLPFPSLPAVDGVVPTPGVGSFSSFTYSRRLVHISFLSRLALFCGVYLPPRFPCPPHPTPPSFSLPRPFFLSSFFLPDNLSLFPCFFNLDTYLVNASCFFVTLPYRSRGEIDPTPKPPSSQSLLPKTLRCLRPFSLIPTLDF